MTKKSFYAVLIVVFFYVSTVAIAQKPLKKPINPNPPSKETTSKLHCKKITTPSLPDGYIEGHGYVDLGLSVKWATCNVGASKVGEYGGFFAFGETETKTIGYTPSTCKTWDKQLGDISRNYIFDTAFANWGGSWRMPTQKEMEELTEKCSFMWISVDGNEGCLVIGPNNKAIFLPASGEFIEKNNRDLDTGGSYWSSTASENLRYAVSLDFLNGDIGINMNYRPYGLSVRPVSD